MGHLRGEQDGPLHLTWGHSKDKRPDLKPFIVSLLGVERDIPVHAALHAGNASDRRINGQVVDRLGGLMAKYGVGERELIVVADSARVIESNLAGLAGTADPKAGDVHAEVETRRGDGPGGWRPPPIGHSAGSGPTRLPGRGRPGPAGLRHPLATALPGGQVMTNCPVEKMPPPARLNVRKKVSVCRHDCVQGPSAVVYVCGRLLGVSAALY